MSRLGDERSGEDHPEAARKHLHDARALAKVNRYDGCAYLAGYVVECAFKSVLLHEASWDERAGEHDRSKLDAERLHRQTNHRLGDLLDDIERVYAAATNRSARYLPRLPTTKAIRGWNPSLRYRAAGHVTNEHAREMYESAIKIYDDTIGKMKLDGVL